MVRFQNLDLQEDSILLSAWPTASGSLPALDGDTIGAARPPHLVQLLTNQ
jgi:hypothetical protein